MKLNTNAHEKQRYQEGVTGPKKKNVTPKQGEKWEEMVKGELK